MRILFSIHAYPPNHNAGGEMYCHAIAKFLVKQGHQVRVLLHESEIDKIFEIYYIDGVEVFPFFPGNNENHISWAQIVITHLGFTSWTVGVTWAFQKPLCWICHNTSHESYDCIKITPKAGIIYNSYAMASVMSEQFQNQSMVLQPSINPEEWDIGEEPWNNEAITLINLNKNKGSRIFFNIARAMPERKFIAVVGGYDDQIIEKLPNVEIVQNTPDIKSVYARTRILLVPSKYESWGMCATEAMACGIPVIYSPTFGLCENVGRSGIKIKDPNPGFVDEDLKVGENPSIDPANWQAWVDKINALDSLKFYKMYSAMGRKRAKELYNEQNLVRVEKFLFHLHDEYEKVIDQKLFQG